MPNQLGLALERHLKPKAKRKILEKKTDYWSDSILDGVLCRFSHESNLVLCARVRQLALIWSDPKNVFGSINPMLAEATTLTVMYLVGLTPGKQFLDLDQATQRAITRICAVYSLHVVGVRIGDMRINIPNNIPTQSRRITFVIPKRPPPTIIIRRKS